jgi:hypothetical protein
MKYLKIVISIATIFCVTELIAQNNYSSADQSGMDNQAYVNQTGSFNTSDLVQGGDYNLANIDQVGSGNYTWTYQSIFSHSNSNNSEVDLDQVGDNNTAWNHQYDGSFFNFRSVQQFGSGNFSHKYLTTLQ